MVIRKGKSKKSSRGKKKKSPRKTKISKITDRDIKSMGNPKYLDRDSKKLYIRYLKLKAKNKRLKRLEKEKLADLASANSDNTRISTTSPSETFSLIEERYKEKKDDMRVLDYGAGNGRGSKYLIDNGFSNVIAYDPYPETHEPLLNIQKAYDRRLKYDLVVSSFVINTLNEKERKEFIRELGSINAEEIIIEARPKPQINDQVRKNPDNYLEMEDDGYVVLSRGTYQKGMDTDDMEKIGRELGMVSEPIRNSQSTIAYIYRKEK